MKVGDLVKIRSGGWRVTGEYGAPPDALGLVMEVARHPQVGAVARYKIWWTAQNKTGWWDAHRLEAISEKSS